MPADFAAVRVTVQARSPLEAMEFAMNSLDFLRGIWNFRLNRGKLERWHFGVGVIQINKLRPGPVHTLHQPSGKPSGRIFWYEPLYPSESKAADIDEWAGVRKEEITIRKCLRASKYPAYLKNAFIRYARSMDSSDHESALLKLWSLLEYLTVCNENEKYDEIIRRTLFAFSDPDYNLRILEHLKSRRNASVHRGEFSTQVESFAYQLKRFVEGLLKYHLTTGRLFTTPGEACLFLSKPREPEVLRQRIAELQRALKFRQTPDDE